MTTRIYEARALVNIFHMIANANPIVEHAIQIKNGIMINVNESEKNIALIKNIFVKK